MTPFARFSQRRNSTISINATPASLPAGSPTNVYLKGNTQPGQIARVYAYTNGSSTGSYVGACWHYQLAAGTCLAGQWTERQAATDQFFAYLNQTTSTNPLGTHVATAGPATVTWSGAAATPTPGSIGLQACQSAGTGCSASLSLQASSSNPSPTAIFAVSLTLGANGAAPAPGA